MTQDRQSFTDQDDRKVWKQPSIRAVVPSVRTSGGPVNLDPSQQDDTWYSGS